jgi:hypothetical protein
MEGDIVDPRENKEFLNWLRSHSGRWVYGEQCKKHPPIKAMTWKETEAAQEEDMGTSFSRWWTFLKCREHEIPTRGKLGPRPSVPIEVKRAKALTRWHRWWRKVTADPEKLESYYASRRKTDRRRRRRLPPPEGNPA